MSVMFCPDCCQPYPDSDGPAGVNNLGQCSRCAEQSRSVYSILNQDAKSWWYYKDLRKYHNYKGARELERASIRKSVKVIRTAALFSQGQYGWHITQRHVHDENSVMTGTYSGYGKDEVYSRVLAKVRPEVPRVSSLSMPNPGKVISFPMFNDESHDPPREDGSYHGMDYAPAGIIVACYEAFGGEVHWGNLDPNIWRQKAVPTIARLREKEKK